MTAFLTFITSPPVVKAVVTAFALLTQFMTGIETTDDTIVGFGDQFKLERAVPRVSAGRVFSCWRIVKVNDEMRVPLSELFDVPEAMIVEQSVHCIDTTGR